jgi:hypothetical protein
VVQDGKRSSLVLRLLFVQLIYSFSQDAFGTCATADDSISTTGLWGVNNGRLTCAGGEFDGQCCSPAGYWQVEDAHHVCLFRS